MGTSYRVVARCPAALDAARIDAVLAGVNASMSTWDDDSEVSRFNASPVGGRLRRSTNVNLRPKITSELRRYFAGPTG